MRSYSKLCCYSRCPPHVFCNDPASAQVWRTGSSEKGALDSFSVRFSKVKIKLESRSKLWKSIIQIENQPFYSVILKFIVGHSYCLC